MPPVTIPKNTGLAQLVPFVSCVSQTEPAWRGDEGFGSTGIPQGCWTQELSPQRPNLTCTVALSGGTPAQVQLSGRSSGYRSRRNCRMEQRLPPQRALVNNAAGVVGLGGMTTSCLSVKPIQIKTQDGQTASVWPYVTTAPLTSWGRDCLGQCDRKLRNN